MRAPLFLILIILTAACSNPATRSDRSHELIRDISGTYSNAEQARKDSAYFELTQVNIRFWEEDPNTIWFYCENYLNRNPSQPAHQRIISFEPQEDGSFLSRFYFIDGFHFYATTSQYRKDLNDLKKEDLILQKGCTFNTVKEADGWLLRSEHQDCISSLNKAEYTDVYYFWSSTEFRDGCKGIDIDGNRVWGPEELYVFKKKAAQ